jgi:hypothetical protein
MYVCGVFVEVSSSINLFFAGLFVVFGVSCTTLVAASLLIINPVKLEQETEIRIKKSEKLLLQVARCY